MSNAADTLPNDVEGLKSRVHELEQSLEQRDQFIHQLLEQIKLSRHQHFGTRSERYSLDQMQLAFNEAEAAAAGAAASGDAADDDASAGEDDNHQTVASYKRRKGGRRPLPDTLPRVEVVHELDEAACTCDAC